MTASAPDPDTAPDPDADRDAPDTDRDPGAVPPVELSARARAVLALERRPWAGPGAKERAIREELGISPVRYFQLLNALIEDERALREDPVTVNRLRRLKEERRGRR
ncbi:DUF3263 domain-containing protein [Streptomyces sp. NPDC012600]|uniref:DUF3263 domain-containing protein n=1 Tax=Streptomyces stephensoniae TaxID=3375367 RepID=A0ABU2VZB9_9ACTN|nr:DUF3263 domain-containing protein [Streptomyces griseus]MDT0490709.1 DUF3263 domain-containing protein [Streptomyces griseus]